MEKDDYGNNVISLDCFCGGKHCEGNLYIQHDVVNEEKVFYVCAIDSNGSDEGVLWLSVQQMEQLLKDLPVLIAEHYATA